MTALLLPDRPPVRLASRVLQLDLNLRPAAFAIRPARLPEQPSWSSVGLTMAVTFCFVRSPFTTCGQHKQHHDKYAYTSYQYDIRAYCKREWHQGQHQQHMAQSTGLGESACRLQIQNVSRGAAGRRTSTSAQL